MGRDCGDQIDYADGSLQVRTMLAFQLAKHGLAPRMDAAYAIEQVELAKKGGVIGSMGCPRADPIGPTCRIGAQTADIAAGV